MSRNKRRSAHDQDLKPFRHPGHRRPVTRRDFLSQGFLSGVGMVMMPSFAQILSPRRAYADLASCLGPGGGGMIPFVCIDLAGGASIAGSNVLVGGPGGQLDFLSQDGYRKLGLPPTLTPDQVGQTNQDLGIAFHSDSALLRGIQARASLTTLAAVDGSIICARSDNDTGNNPHNPMYGINAAGASGSLMALVGTEASDSGGNSLAPAMMIDLTVRPTKVDRPSDARGLVDTGQLVGLLGQSDAAAVMRATEDISAAKLDKLVGESLELRDLLMCGYLKATDQVANFGDPNQLDPREDPLIVDPANPAASIFSRNEIDNDGKFRKTASVMKLVLNGQAGAGTIEMGGYDYHDGTRATGERRDQEAGECIGAILEYAARLGTPLMLYVFSDGSLASDGQLDNTITPAKGVWRGDNSSTAASLMLVYNPLGVRPPLRTAASQQIGYYRASGDVETASTRVANSVTTLAQSVVLNYLALHGAEGTIDSVVPGHSLGTPGERDQLIAFGQLV